MSNNKQPKNNNQTKGKEQIKMNVILCKPNMIPQVVSLAENHNYEDVKSYLEIDTPMTCITRKIAGEYYDLWCDDEGLLYDKKYACGISKDGKEFICGNILITTHNSKGETKGLTDEQIVKVLFTCSNWMNNKLFLKMFLSGLKSKGINETIDEKGNLVILEDYLGFGKIKLNQNGYLLRYEF